MNKSFILRKYQEYTKNKFLQGQQGNYMPLGLIIGMIGSSALGLVYVTTAFFVLFVVYASRRNAKIKLYKELLGYEKE